MSLKRLLSVYVFVILPLFAHSEQKGVTSVVESHDKIHFNINTAFYFGPKALRHNRLSNLFLTQNEWDFTHEISAPAADCLTRALNSSGAFHKPVKVTISVDCSFADI